MCENPLCDIVFLSFSGASFPPTLPCPSRHQIKCIAIVYVEEGNLVKPYAESFQWVFLGASPLLIAMGILLALLMVFPSSQLCE